MTLTSLFYKLVISMWIFCLVFMFAGMFAGQMVNFRFADGRLGLLNHTISQFAQQRFDQRIMASFRPVKADAQLCNTFTGGACLVWVLNTLGTVNSEPGQNARFSIDQALRAALRAALLAFLRAIISFLLAQFRRLLDAVARTIEAVTGIRLNLGSVYAALALKAWEGYAWIEKRLDQAFDGLFGTNSRPNPNNQFNQAFTQLGNDVSGYLVGSAISSSQGQLPSNVRVPSLSQPDLERSSALLSDTYALLVCDSKKATLVDNAPPLWNNMTWGYNSMAMCRFENQNKMSTTLTRESQYLNNATQEQQSVVNRQNAEDCKDGTTVKFGTMQLKSSTGQSLNLSGDLALAGVNQLFTTSSFGGSGLGTINADGTNWQVDTSGATNLRFATADLAALTGNLMTFNPITPDACGQITPIALAAANATKQGQGESESLVDILLSVLQEFIMAIFDAVVDFLMQIILGAIQKLTSVLPNFMSNFVSSISNILTTQLRVQLGELRKQLVDKLKDAF